MTKLLRLSLLLVVTSAATQASSQSPASEPKTPPPVTAGTAETKLPDLGHLDGGDYVNNFFGLSLSVPRAWVIVSAQRRDEITEESKKMIQTDDQRKKEQVNASVDRSTNLLSLTKLPVGQPGNASFMLIAERIPSPSIQTGSDVIRAMERLAKGTNFNLEFQDGIRTEQIGAASFGVATVKNSSPRGVYMQKVYVTTRNGYALQLFYTYVDEADLLAFDSIIKSLKIK
jgi:hypothetical protein